MTGPAPVRRLAALRGHRRAPAPAYRPAALDDLPAASRVWSAALSDYLGRLNQPTFEPDLTPIHRLLAHFLATDPDRFWVATRPGPDDRPAPGDVGAGGERIVGFGSATVRFGTAPLRGHASEAEQQAQDSHADGRGETRVAPAPFGGLARPPDRAG